MYVWKDGKEVEPTVQYTEDHRKRRVQLAVSIVEYMVKAGFTFFSSVLVDNTGNTQHEFHVPLNEGDYASVDSMLFHLPGKGCILRIALNEAVSRWTSGRHDMYMSASVTLQFKHADLPTFGLPWKNRDPNLTLWSYHGGVRSKNVCQLRIESSPRRFDYCECDIGPTPHDFENRLADLVQSIKDVEPFLSLDNDGRIDEFGTLALWPHSVFRDCKADFFERFNTYYFRKLVKRTY